MVLKEYKAEKPTLEARATQQSQRVTPVRQKPTGNKADIQHNNKANRIDISKATETYPTDKKIRQPKPCSQKNQANTNNNPRKMSAELNSNLAKPSSRNDISVQASFRKKTSGRDGWEIRLGRIPGPF